MKPWRWLVCTMLLGLLILTPLEIGAQGDERWAEVFQLPGVDSYVYATALDGAGNLYVGGAFTVAGGWNENGGVTVNHVARWDASRRVWSALGGGLNGAVNALALDGSGNLYAGGDFTEAGGVSADHIARWDGTTWSALGSGLDGSVEALLVDGNGDLYTGGSFTLAGSLTVSRIARWDP